MKPLIFICTLVLLACNPVKQVLKDPAKFDKMKEAVIRSGACVTDTVTVETIKDTVIYKDSLVQYSVPCPDVKDTIIGHDGTQITIKNGVLTAKHKAKETQRTVKVTNTVRDRSYENILKADIAQRDSAIKAYIQIVSQEQAKVASAKKDAATWKWRLWLLVGVLAVYKLRKPILRAITGI